MNTKPFETTNELLLSGIAQLVGICFYAALDGAPDGHYRRALASIKEGARRAPRDVSEALTVIYIHALREPTPLERQRKFRVIRNPNLH
jgi:thiosulfate reductase cytochrome b subunit